jgi:hypothetical protein
MKPMTFFNKTIFAIILFISTVNANAQIDTSASSRYKCQIDMIDKGKFVLGEIYKAADSSLIIKNKVVNEKAFSRDTYLYTDIPVTQIVQINLKMKADPGKGFLKGGLIGLGVGAFLGAIILLSSVDEESRSSSGDITSAPLAGGAALVSCATGFFLGGFIGLAASPATAKIVIPINGKKENYDSKRGDISRYSIVN